MHEKLKLDLTNNIRLTILLWTIQHINTKKQFTLSQKSVVAKIQNT